MRTIPVGAPRWVAKDPQETIDSERESLDAQAPAEEPTMRFVLAITDRRSGHGFQVEGSTPFVALDIMRATLARPELLLGGGDLEPDPWGGRA